MTHTQAPPTHLRRGIAGRGVDQLAVSAIGLLFVVTGLQAAFMPRTFFDDFPFGRSWIIATEGAYNEHLVRDVGGLFLAMVIVSLWSWWRPALCLPVAVAWLVSGTIHLVFHLAHLEHLDTVDAVGVVASLAIVPVLAVVAIVADRVQRRPAAGWSSHPR